MFLGPLNQFDWHNDKSKIRFGVTYKLKTIDFVVNGSISSAKLVDVNGAEIALNVEIVTYDLDGNSITKSRIHGSLANGSTYYINIDNSYYSDFIERDVCGIEISSTNLCNDTLFGWQSNSYSIKTLLFNAREDIVTTEFEKDIFVSATGKKDKIKSMVLKHSIVFIGPTAFNAFLNSFSANEVISIDNVSVKNLVVNKEEVDANYSKFTLIFEYIELIKKSGCCDELNLDNIINVGTSGGNANCTGFDVSVTFANDLITAVPTGTGPYFYKWFLNNVLQSTGSTILVNNNFGEYRVEVTANGCFAKASMQISDPCLAMQVKPYSTGDQINADIINAISGNTISVYLNNAVVATSLPFTATSNGVYYIYATKDNCKRSGAVSINLDQPACNYTAFILKSGSNLTAQTNLVSPSYKWEIETLTGKTLLGNSASVAINGNGIYWLTISQGACEKISYYYHTVVSNQKIINVLRLSGFEFNVYEIDLLAANPNELEVIINGSVYYYVSGVPNAANQYSIKADGKLITWSAAPFTNAIIKIKTL